MKFKEYYKLICEVTVEQVKTRFESKAWKRAIEQLFKYLDYKKDFDDLDDTVRMALYSDFLPNDIDENSKGNALNWLVSIFIKDPTFISRFHSQSNRVRSSLELFYQIKQVRPVALSVKAIEQIADINDLYTAVGHAKPVYDEYLQNRAEKDTKTDINNSKVLETAEWNVYVPKTKGAAIQLGKGTDWCTAAPGLQYYERYTKTSPLIIFVSKTEPEEWRYQFWYGDDETPGQFMDIHDQSITEGAEKRKIFFYLNNIVKQLNINADVQKRAEQYNYETLEDGRYMISIPERIRYFNSNDKLHRDDGPASISYFDNTRNNISNEAYYQNGLMHRDNGPASITYLKDGSVIKSWYTKGKLTQNNLPNFVRTNSNGTEHWSFSTQNGVSHREGGPAAKLANGTLEWRVRGMLHNPDGPAVIHPSGVKDYYLKNTPYSEEEFNNKELWKKAVYDSQFQH